MGQPTRTRDDPGKHVWPVIDLIHTQTGAKCKVIECDGAAEFVGPESKFELEASQRGIIIRPSMPHCPEQNHTPESTHDVRGGVTRTFRIAARMPKNFWAEASRFAAYCIAYTVKKGQTKTPFERLLKIKPSFKLCSLLGVTHSPISPKRIERNLTPKHVLVSTLDLRTMAEGSVSMTPGPRKYLLPALVS